MKISNASLHALLASAAAFTGVTVEAFGYSSTSIRQPLANLYSSLPSSSARPTSTSTSSTRTRRNQSKSTILFAEKGKGEQDNQIGKALDGVDDVAAEAQAALLEAQKALDLLNPNKNNDKDKDKDNQLIDVDELATADSTETLSIMEKLASGKLSSQDATSKLIEKQTQVQTQKLQEETLRQETQKLQAQKQSLAEKEKIKGEAVSASIGGAAFGAMAGIALDVYLDIKGVTEIEPIVPPFLLGSSFAAAAFGVGSRDNSIGEVVRNVLGGTVQSLSNSVSSSIGNAVDSAVKEVKATPTKIKTAVDAKVKETTEEISKIPGKVKDSATSRAEELSNEIKQIPGKVKDSAQKSAENTKREIENVTKKAVEDVRAAPGRVADETKKAFVSAVEDAEDKIEKSIKSTEEKIGKTINDTNKKFTDTVDEVVALPGKTLDKISGGVSKVIPTEKKEPKPDTATTSAPDRVPKPPEMPPPESMLKEMKAIAKPSTPPPKPAAEAVKVSPTLSIPKITVPKINLPTVPKVKQETPKPVPAKKEEKANDDFVFSEVSLQNLMAKDKKDKPPVDDEPVASKDKDDDSDRPNFFDIMKNNAADADADADNNQKQKDAQLAAAKKLKQAAEAKKDAAEERIIQAEMRKQVQLEAVAEKNRLAEERRLEAKRIADEKKEKADKMRKQAEEKRAAEVRLQRAKPGATISLGFFGMGGQQDDKDKDTGDDKSVQSAAALAPKGVPTMTKWRQNKDGSVTGLISGSSAFPNGESITTSPITTKDPSTDSVVTTVSGSRYYLDANLAPVGFFGFGSPRSPISPPSTPKPETTSESKEDPLAKARQIAEEKKASALAAAEARKRQVEERRAAADEKRREAEEKRQASIAAREEAESKRQAEKLLSKSSGGTISLGANSQKKQQAQSAEKAISKAKPGATISLGFFFGQNQDKESSTKPSSTAAPRGVPTVTKWKQNRDGSISGFISGSNSFKDGESITTSPLTTKSPAGESVVSTISGSKYFLDTVNSAPSLGGFFGSSPAKVAPSPAPNSVPQPDKNTKMQQLAEERKAAAEARKLEGEERRQAALEAAEAKKQEAAEKRSLLEANRKQVAEERRQAALEAAEARKRDFAERTAAQEAVRKEKTAKAAEAAEARKRGIAERAATQEAARKEQAANAAGAAEARKRESAQEAARKKQAAKAAAAVANAKPGGTISLGFFNFGQSEKDDRDKPTIVVSSAPSGVPTLSKWKQNFDGSITGFISGSNAYRNGESITTSPITSKPADNAVVQTTSGSKYYLVPKTAPATPKPVPPKKVAPKIAPVSKTKQSAAAAAVGKARPGATISLGFLNFGSDDKNEDTGSDKSGKGAPQVVSQAPRGVPTITSWRQNRDGSISGKISGSSAYSDGEAVTTSSITTDAVDGGLVNTTSGSRYFLAPKSAPKSQFGGFFGGGSGANTVQASNAPTSAAESLKKQAEERKAAAEAKKSEADEKRKAAVAGADARKREADEKREAAVAAADARKREADEKRKAAVAAADERKREADEKRKAALAAAESKKQEAAQKRKAAQDAANARQREAEAKRSKAQQSEKVVAEAPPRATVSLGFLNFGQSDKDTSSPPSTPSTDAKKPSTKMASAPRGVPTLYTWRQNRDGSVTGLIAGSNSYSDGESVTTSPLSTDTAFGSLVQTASGSKYYLASKGAKVPKAPEPTTSTTTTRSTFSLGKPKPESPSKPAARTTFSLGKPPAAAKSAPAPKSFFGGSSPAASKPKPKAKKPAPRGVPKISKWRTNRDSSITGIISGSPGYDDGDRVTTSAIVSGTVEAGEVVQTGSGSKYYLD